MQNIVLAPVGADTNRCFTSTTGGTLNKAKKKNVTVDNSDLFFFSLIFNESL